MAIILFIIILAVLILVHELGHFLAAKISKIRVDEFGLGFPPRAIGKKIGETIYSLNWIPFGGFVKIFGETPDEESIDGPDKDRSFVHKNSLTKIWVLAAGVIFNVVFAWLLLTVGFMSGFPTPVGYISDVPVQNPHLVITQILPNSPAEVAGLESGDQISALSQNDRTVTTPDVKGAQDFISGSGEEPINISIVRGSEHLVVKVTPKTGILSDKVALGVSMDMVGLLKLPLYRAAWESVKTTGYILEATAIGLGTFIKGAFVGVSNLNEVTGPVGIVGLVGSASQLGWIYLLSFTAFISLNLAVINIIPFPALDGGRILFVIIERIKGRRIKPQIANTLNSIGFALLLILMAVVTLHDIVKLF